MKITEVTEFWFKSSLKLFVKSKSTSENIIYRIVAIVLIRKYNRLDLGQSRINLASAFDRIPFGIPVAFMLLRSFTLSLFHSTRWHSVYASLEAVDTKMHGYPQFLFWIPRALAKFYFLRLVLNHPKISQY